MSSRKLKLIRYLLFCLDLRDKLLIVHLYLFSLQEMVRLKTLETIWSKLSAKSLFFTYKTLYYYWGAKKVTLSNFSF